MDWSYAYAVLLLLYAFIRSIDGKGGGGGDDAVPISPVTISLIGSAEVGKAIKMQCDFKTLQEPESIFWFEGNDIKYAKQGEALYVSPKITASTEDFKTTKSHHITIKQATLDDSKSITCQVKPKGKGEQSGTFALVVGPHLKLVYPLNAVTLKCISDASGLLLWKKDKSVIIFNNTIIDSNKRFSLEGKDCTIQNITTGDAGVYTCYVNGKRADSTKLTVYVPPVIVLSALRGYRGYLFGGSLAVIILGTVGLALYIQKKPFEGAELIIIDDE